MSTQFIEAVDDIQQNIQDFESLFLNSLSLKKEDIKLLDDIELERNFIAATYLLPSTVMSLQRDYDNLYENLEREYMEAERDCDASYARNCKDALYRLQNLKSNRDKMISLFHLLPALTVERNNRCKHH